jgi:hypothetical protein
MANNKTLLQNISSLVHNGLMSEAEANKYRRRLDRKVQAQEEAAKVLALVPKAKEFMTPGVQYSISDLVLGLMGIKAPCHGYAETKAEQKHRDGVAKPLVKAVLEHIGATTLGSGAQTKYMVEPQLPALCTLDQVDEA